MLFNVTHSEGYGNNGRVVDDLRKDVGRGQKKWLAT